MNEHRERLGFPPRWLMFVAVIMCLLAVLAGVGILVYDKVSATADKNTAQANSQTLALDIRRVCEQQGKLMVDDRDLCAKAEKVQEQPTEALPGPKGDRGNDGTPGKTGVPGPLGPKGETGDRGPLGPVGPKGDKGDTGDDGLAGLTIPGAAGTPGTVGPMGPQGERGPSGEPGKDGAAGPAGPPGTPGADGAPGADGTDGRGIQSAMCGDDGRWTITYTDGTTSDGGQCRTNPGPPIGVTP